MPNESVGTPLRLNARISGTVQGVGFRPFVYRLATQLGLQGWVSNSSAGVIIEAEGSHRELNKFLTLIKRDGPIRSTIDHLETAYLPPVGYSGFTIRESLQAQKTTWVPPDLAVCAECMGEVHEPGNRRYLYPFTNCTNCGPRFSIIQSLPYDRRNTTMTKFTMCEMCRAEYDDALDRRFHAQPNSCPKCGPQLAYWDHRGKPLAAGHRALNRTTESIRNGAIVAMKGLGGFQLLVDARSDVALRRLRHRKHREEKPFALLYPSLQYVKQHCQVSPLEEKLLTSPASPIVILAARQEAFTPGEGLSALVAPGNPYLGVMLPYTPLHYLLMEDLGLPVVATSANQTEEPICIDEEEALERLHGIADFFLVHDRPIIRPVDDSVVSVVHEKEMVLRRARGYAPHPLPVDNGLPEVIALGGHLKNTVAIPLDRSILLSQHIGDLSTKGSFQVFKDTLSGLLNFYGSRPGTVACDSHPDYPSTRFAEGTALPVMRIQHHHAHVVSCMVENRLEGEVLGVAWDGTGYGTDGTVWGGEFLLANKRSMHRVGHLRTLRLLGGDKAVKEPRRSALSLLFEIFGDDLFETEALNPLKAFSAQEIKILHRMLQRNLNGVPASSAGRIFDAVASILGLCQVANFEGQAAMAVEFACHGKTTEENYPVSICSAAMDDPRQAKLSQQPPDPLDEWVVDWEPMVRSLLNDLRQGVEIGQISAKFHNGLAECIVTMAEKVQNERVLLTGGCFQNRYLLERTIRRLREARFHPYWHGQIPPNDGGISLGQLVIAAAQLQKG